MLAGRVERFPSCWVGREREQTVIKVQWCHPKFLFASRPAELCRWLPLQCGHRLAAPRHLSWP